MCCFLQWLWLPQLTAERLFRHSNIYVSQYKCTPTPMCVMHAYSHVFHARQQQQQQQQQEVVRFLIYYFYSAGHY